MERKQRVGKILKKGTRRVEAKQPPEKQETKYASQLEGGRKNQSIVQIGGIWKGVKISSGDIKKVRKSLFERIEEKW